MLPNQDAAPAQPRRRRWLLAVLVVLAVALSVPVVRWWYVPGAASVEVDEDDKVAATGAPGYVGVQACAACHASRVAEFQRTNHFRAGRLPEPGAMPAGFAPGKGNFRTREPGLRFEMTQEGAAFLQSAIRSTPEGEQRTSTPIDLAYGNPTADEVYFAWQGDQLFELPMVWLHPQERWAMVTHDPFGQGNLARETTPRCLECHNTWFEHIPGTRNRYRRDHLILGVTCEKCHGPGQDHVAYHEAHPAANAGQAIVHPGRLGRERQLEVCAQCHSNAITHRGPAFRYRPGEPLADYYRTLTTRHPEEDHVGNQVQYLRQSKCFQTSEMTCTSCHNPHRANAPATARACGQCHQPAECAEQPRVPAEVRANCVGCHMPDRAWINVHFHTEDDQYVPAVRRHEHRIAIDPVARQEVLRAWYSRQPDDTGRREAARLTQALVEHWQAEAERRRKDHRFLAAIGALREAVRLDPGPKARARLQEVVAIQAKLDADWALALKQTEQRRPQEAIVTLQGILAVKPDLGRAHGKLGTLYAATGNNTEAVQHLQEAARLDPDDPYGEMMLGWLAYLQGRAAEAAEAYARADAIDPYSAQIHYHRALALVQLDELAQAGACLRRLLTIDPNHAGGCQALSDVLRRQQQPAEALRFARRADRLTGGRNPDILLTLADACADLGRWADAEAALGRALVVAEASNPRLVPQLRARQAEIRTRAGAAH